MAREANKQVETAQKHTNNEVLMAAEELVGVIDLDNPTIIIHPTIQEPIVGYTLHYVLLNFSKMSNGCSAIAEVHQGGLSKPTHLIIPNMPEAEQLVGIMNKNLPVSCFTLCRSKAYSKISLIVSSETIVKQQCWPTCPPAPGILQIES
jgi:hypothetical protein